MRSKLSMSRLSCVPKENSCAPKLIICGFMSRLSCVQKTLCGDFPAFKRPYVQTLVRSKDLMYRLSCVQNCLCPDFCAFQWKIRELQNLFFARSCPDFRAFKRSYLKTFVRSKLPTSRLLCVPKKSLPLQN